MSLVSSLLGKKVVKKRDESESISVGGGFGYDHDDEVKDVAEYTVEAVAYSSGRGDFSLLLSDDEGNLFKEVHEDVRLVPGD